jgi:hypothetical protein
MTSCNVWSHGIWLTPTGQKRAGRCGLAATPEETATVVGCEVPDALLAAPSTTAGWQ